MKVFSQKIKLKVIKKNWSLMGHFLFSVFLISLHSLSPYFSWSIRYYYCFQFCIYNIMISQPFLEYKLTFYLQVKLEITTWKRWEINIFKYGKRAGHRKTVWLLYFPSWYGNVMSNLILMRQSYSTLSCLKFSGIPIRIQLIIINVEKIWS